MSILCHECEVDLQPSNALPGREGGIVTPNVLALVWVPQDGKPDVWVSTVVEPTVDVALCFECIVKKLPEKSRGAIELVFSAYQAETAHGRLEFAHRGKWINLDEMKDTADLWKVFKARFQAVPQNSCLFCETKIPGDQKTFFTIRAIDKARCENKPSVFGSYQISHLSVGITSFKICFGCFRQGFPRIFAELSYALRGTGESNSTIKGELYLSPEVMRQVFGVTPN